LLLGAAITISAESSGTLYAEAGQLLAVRRAVLKLHASSVWQRMRCVRLLVRQLFRAYVQRWVVRIYCSFSGRGSQCLLHLCCNKQTAVLCELFSDLPAAAATSGIAAAAAACEVAATKPAAVAPATNATSQPASQPASTNSTAAIATPQSATAQSTATNPTTRAATAKPAATPPAAAVAAASS
jgi:hypothetical protein